MSRLYLQYIQYNHAVYTIYAQRKARREKWDKLRCGKYITRWWFQLCFDFHPLLGGNDPI